MIRRARLSFKPNVRPGGRAAGGAGSGRDGGGAPAAEPEPGKESKPASLAEHGTAPPSGGPGDAQPREQATAEAIEIAAPISNEAPLTKTPSAPLQRRKRISTLPNLAKPRVPNTASAAIPPPKPTQVDAPSVPPVTSAPCKNEGSLPEKGKVLSPQKSQVPVPLPQGQHVTLPEKRTPVPQVPQFSPYKKSVLKHQEVSPTKPVECAQKEEPSPLKERPSQKSCSNELFEVIKKPTPKKKLITSNLEKERLKRAQKLRDLLRAELRKERKAWKEKHPIINPMVEPEKSKMTMRDFIHFIPLSNPMSSSLEESKSSEKSSPVESQVAGLGGKNSAEEDDPDDDDEEDDSQLLAPRVKVAEDGSIILDEESLTVEVSRNKAPIVEGNDPIFERGSTTTYSSFRRNNYSKPWSDPETDMFFLAISMVGTDFSMIGQLFPHRERIEIKNKFKKEERVNGWRIDKAFREKKDFDFEFFTQLLEKALEAGKKKKAKIKQPRKTSAKPRKKQKDKTAEQSLCDDESVISDEEGADSRTAEKENKRSLDDESSTLADPGPVKKKRSKRKKENTKEPEEDNRDSQDDAATQKPKKSRKGKTAAQDTDTGPELQSADNDGSLKETPAVKKTRVQKNKPNYKESEFEEDADYDLTEDLAVNDVKVPCKAEDAAPPAETTDETREEESSVVLFSEESDYQSGLEDLSGLQHSLNEVKEAVSRASDVSVVAANSVLGEIELINVTQEETSPSACDECDKSDAGSGQSGDQDLDPKDKLPQVRRARPAPNLSKAAVKKKVSTEDQSDIKHQADPSADTDVGKSNKGQKEDLNVDEQRQAVEAAKADNSSAPHNGQKESSIKPSILAKGRLLRPKPNLPGRTSTRKEKLDVPDSKDVSVEEADKGADEFLQNKTESTENLNREADVSLVKDRQDASSAVQVSSVKKDAGSDSDPPQKEESQTLQQVCDKGDTSKEKPCLPVRGRLRPKPNLTRAPANKPSDAEQEVQRSQVSESKSPSHTPDRDGENGAKERAQSSVPQEECGKSPIKPAPIARGRFQKPKPNLIKANSRKESVDVKQDSSAPSAGHTEGDSGGDLQSDISSGKQENEMLMNTGSGSSQDSCKSEINSHSSSSLQLIQDSAASQDHLIKSLVSETESVTSPIKPAPLALGRLQRPELNLVRTSGRKGELEMKASESSVAVSGGAERGSPTELAEEVGAEGQCTQESSSEKPDSTMPLKVDGESLTEEPSTPLKPAELPKGRFQRPKPNLGRAAAKRDGLTSLVEPKDIPKEEVCTKNSVEPKDTTSKISVNEVETAPLLAKNHRSPVAEEDSVTLGKTVNGASSETCIDSTPATSDKEQSESDNDRKTLKPALKRSLLQRPKPNLSKSCKRSAGSAPLVSTIQEDKKRIGATSTGNNSPNVSLDVEALSDGEAVNDACAKSAVKALAQPEEAISNTQQGEAATLKPVRSRFTKPIPNLGRAAIRKETSTPESKKIPNNIKWGTCIQSQETSKDTDDDPEVLKIEGIPDISIAGHDCKEAGHVIEEKPTAIKPAQLKRGRLIRPVPNLVKQSTKTLSPLQSRTNEDLNSVPTSKDEDHEVVTSSPAEKRKAPHSNVELSPKSAKRICPSSTSQRPSYLSDSEVDQVSSINQPPGSSQSSSVQNTSPPRCSRFGRTLRKLSTVQPLSPASENSSDRPERERTVRNVKSSTPKVSKPGPSKGKTTLVKIRATQQQEDDEDDADLGFEDETYDLSPDMQNQAPVFVPFSLRSPKPVTAEIEETVEELEIPVDVVDLPSQDLGGTPFQHVVDPATQMEKRGEFLNSDQCTEVSSIGRLNNQDPLTSIELLSSPSRSLLLSPHHDVFATERSVPIDPRMPETPHSAPDVETKIQADVLSSGFVSAENLPDPINDALALPIGQATCPVMQGDALQHDFSSQHVSVSDCLLGEHDTGEEATFILTLVEIPINEEYAYSCASNLAESLPAPVLISSGSSQLLTQNLNPSTETVSYEPCADGQGDKYVILGQTSEKRSAECIDEGDRASRQNIPLVSEQQEDLEISASAVETNDGEVAHEVSVTEPKNEEPAGVSQIGTTSVRERPPNWRAAKNCGTVPVEMPGTSVTDSVNRNLPLVYTNPTTSKMPLKRPGKKPLGFLSLVCKEKQLKKANEENRKKKTLPMLKSRKVSPTLHGRQRKSPDVNLENVNDLEVPSLSPIFPPEEIQNTTEEAKALPSTSQVSENQEPEVQSPSKSHDLATEEEAAPVSEYFFSDIFMEVDD